MSTPTSRRTTPVIIVACCRHRPYCFSLFDEVPPPFLGNYSANIPETFYVKIPVFKPISSVQYTNLSTATATQATEVEITLETMLEPIQFTAMLAGNVIATTVNLRMRMVDSDGNDYGAADNIGAVCGRGQTRGTAQDREEDRISKATGRRRQQGRIQGCGPKISASGAKHPEERGGSVLKGGAAFSSLQFAIARRRGCRTDSGRYRQCEMRRRAKAERASREDGQILAGRNVGAVRGDDSAVARQGCVQKPQNLRSVWVQCFRRRRSGVVRVVDGGGVGRAKVRKEACRDAYSHSAGRRSMPEIAEMRTETFGRGSEAIEAAVMERAGVQVYGSPTDISLPTPLFRP
ncbi:hypothetical protein R3P38DRAFT_2808251 [Favolaschia claudopus]|uniref:Uncharacterized protein n=1 Tax=Favolaschia claudopus TaxID=2862362 RepID=A0AAV9ZGD6_9AGAR